MNAIKVILVDDHAVVRAGFRLLLSSIESIEVVGEAGRGEQACQLYQEKKPDVVVMDLSMPGIGGLETVRRIRQRDNDAKILVFSVHDENVYIDRAMTAGAKGYICKNSAPEILIEAILKIADGQVYIEHGLVVKKGEESKALDYQLLLQELSSREFDVFCLLAKGLTTHNIADQLCISNKTVANYGTQIKHKLKVNSVAELTRIAIILGVIKQ